jgi:protein-tyrosine phosphatase
MAMQQILFICSGNYYRSRYAEVVFNHYATHAGLSWSAASRGFRLHAQNVGPMSPHTVRALEAAGLDFDRLRWPMVLAEQDLQQASRVIALKEAEHRAMMRAYFPAWEDRIEYWSIHDIDVAQPEVALVELHASIQRLIQDIQ